MSCVEMNTNALVRLGQTDTMMMQLESSAEKVGDESRVESWELGLEEKLRRRVGWMGTEKKVERSKGTGSQDDKS